MRRPSGESDHKDAERITASAGEIARGIRYAAPAAESRAANAHAARRRLPGTYGERPRVRESRERQDAHVAGCGAAADTKRSPDILHQLRDVGAGTADCQAGPETEQTDQKVFSLRGHDH